MSIENHFSPYKMHPPIRKFITDENGKTLSVVDWCKVIGKGLVPDVVYNRMRRTTDPKALLRTDNLRRRVQ